MKLRNWVSVLGSGLITTLVYCATVSSYEIDTHKALSHQATEDSALDSILTNNLGMSRGITTSLLDGTTRKTVLSWIREGSAREDDFTIFPFGNSFTIVGRFQNHFHHPLRQWGQAGLNDSVLGIPLSGVSSAVWGQTRNQEGGKGSWSWQETRERYYLALTSENKEDREKYLARTFRGLGHQIHLIQDASSVAHARNEAHAFGFNFETWTLDKFQEKRAGDFAQVLGRRPRILPDPQLFSELADSAASIPVGRFIDADRYSGSNPDTTALLLDGEDVGGQAVKLSPFGLAEYANANFVHGNTVFTDTLPQTHKWWSPYPRRSSTNLAALGLPEEIEAEDGRRDQVWYIKKERDGEIIEHFLKASYSATRARELGEDPPLELEFLLDDRVYEDYARLLLPRAVGYSAALLDYFFRGKLKGVLQRVEGPPGDFFSPPYTVELKLTNETDQETMEGDFRLYVDRPDGTREQLADFGRQTLAAGETKTLSFTVEEGFGVVEQFFVVFEGRLGEEQGAVAGSVVKPAEFREEWDLGLTGSHPWWHSTENSLLGNMAYRGFRNRNNGISMNEVVEGRLIKDNNRVSKDDKQVDESGNPLFKVSESGWPRFNVSLVGPIFKDGVLIRDFLDVLPIPIISRTEIRVKIDNISINEQPPAEPGFTRAWQIVQFIFSDRRYIQLTVPGHQATFSGANGVALRIIPGVPMTFNIHKELARAGIPVDNLVLRHIVVEQELFPYFDPITETTFSPDPLARMQHMEVDYIRVSDRPFDSDADPGTGGEVLPGSGGPSAVGLPPSVTLTSPERGEVFEGEVITLSADATDDDGQVVSVEFAVNGVSQFVDTSAPFETQFEVPVGVTSLIITLTATDDAGNSSTVGYLVSVIPPPDIVITSPVEGATVIEGDLITLSASTTANFQAVSVEFTVNGVSQFVDTSAPFETQFEVPVGISFLIITATATDSLGRTTTATRTVTVQPDPPPTVVITSPVAGSTVFEGQTITIRSTTQDNTGVVFVQYFVNGTRLDTIIGPFGGIFTAVFTVPVGVTELRIDATAVDTKGIMGFATPVVVNVIPDPPPTVVITSPAEGTTLFEGSQVPFIAEATDNVRVTQVVWSVNGVVQSPLISPPYQQVVTVPTGVTSLTIQVTATDNLGQTGTVTRTIAVQPDPGMTVVITSPTEGSTVIEGSRLTLTAEVINNFGVTEVAWSINGVAQASIFNPPYQTVVVVPIGMPFLTIQAKGTDSISRNGLATRTIAIQADPGTTVVGRILDTGGQPLAGATVTAFEEFRARSQSDGRFSIPAVPSVRGGIRVVVKAFVGATTLRGVSATFAPVTGGITDVGDIVLESVEAPLYPGQVFAAVRLSRSVAVADLNGDDKLDVVTANFSNDVSVLIGNGDGTFQAEQRFSVGAFPNSIAVADFNGDGSPDIVTANRSSNDVSVLLGAGDGTFQPQSRFAAGALPNAVAVGDLNGDGVPDIVTANHNSTDVSVLLGNGDGTFQPQSRFAVNTFLESVEVADINRDGSLDILVGSFRDFFVFLGNGNGTFQAPRRFSGASTFMEAADVNQDGIPDLIMVNDGSGTPISVLLGNGDGTFRLHSRFGLVSLGSHVVSLAVADVNRDGSLDLVVSAFGDMVTFLGDGILVFLGNGDGTFEPPQLFAGGSPAVAVGDVNGDGHPDLLPTHGGLSTGGVAVLFGNGDGTFVAPLHFRAGDDESTRSVAVADLNGDGNLDIVTTNQFFDDVSVLLGNGDGTFQTEQHVATGSRPTSVAIADLNGDGIPDLVTANRNSDDVSILFGNGDGSFQPEQFLTVGDAPSSVVVADLNGDGAFDIIVANELFNDISVFLGNGDGSFQPEDFFSVGSRPNSVAVADLNLDGIPDLVTANTNTDDISILFGNGDGSFQPEQFLAVGDGPMSVAIADLNDDGIPDVATANVFSDDVSILLGNGDGTFQPEQRFAAGDFPRSLAVTDLNGDGIADIVTANSFSRDISVFLGNGDGTFQPEQRFAADRGLSVAVADLNGNGASDLAIGIPGHVVILLRQ